MTSNGKMTPEQLEEVKKYVALYPIDPYWDSNDGLCNDGIDWLLFEGEEGRLKVQDSLWENVIESIWEEERYVLQNAIDELELGVDTDYLREHDVYPTVDIDVLRLARNTKGYVALRLDVEHVMYFQDYEEVDEELEFFGINPADLKEFYPEIEWPNIPDRTTPLISAEEIADAWANFYSSGYWYAMLDAGEVLETAYKGELRDEMVLKAGALIILHDYWNGTSGIDCRTLADLKVETGGLGNDGSSRYGIQSCCGLVDEAWSGVLE